MNSKHKIISFLALGVTLALLCGAPAAAIKASSDGWLSTTLNGAPQARAIHTAVWTGSEMLIWGGQTNDSQREGTGAKYNPTTDTWTSISTINAPSPRRGHTAIWTGSEMIVWGGEAGGGAVNTGARYDPITDTWTPISTVNAPPARLSHTAIWTGSEMIVWGGEAVGGSINTVLNSGGRYNPTTDTWTPITTTNAPTARFSHTAIWTGSEMIVWGGTKDGNGGGGIYVNTGGRYNPTTDTWTPTSLINAPPVMSSHTAIWTGNEMIVWGGASDEPTAYTNAGGRYNPETNTWTLITQTGAPTPRGYATSVWTGSEMIVWGGYNGYRLNTGGRYNPANDSWTSTTLNGAPYCRNAHTAVWTGNDMIIWGGWNFDGSSSIPFLNSGGKYNTTMTSTEPQTLCEPAASTPTPTETQIATPNSTPTDTPTNTSVPPTNTSTNTPINTPTATNTPVPPTNTPINTPTATNTPVPPAQLTALSPAAVWVGLKNSDDVGIKFDLLAEVYKDGTTLVGSGQLNGVAGGSSGFNNARLNAIPLSLNAPVDWPSGSTLSTKLYVRNTCSGNTHNSGTARLWYNDAAANSQFGATIRGTASDYFLVNNFALATTAGPGPKQTIDVAAGSPCSPFKLFGSWIITP